MSQDLELRVSAMYEKLFRLRQSDGDIPFPQIQAPALIGKIRRKPN